MRVNKLINKFNNFLNDTLQLQDGFMGIDKEYVELHLSEKKVFTYDFQVVHLRINEIKRRNS